VIVAALMVGSAALASVVGWAAFDALRKDVVPSDGTNRQAVKALIPSVIGLAAGVLAFALLLESAVARVGPSSQPAHAESSPRDAAP
jgi:hypothetical protein